MNTVVFESPRLIIRRIGPTDADAMYAVYSDAEAMRWVDDGRPLARDECDRWIQVTLNNYTVRGYGMFALQQRDSGEVIGFCGLVHTRGQEEVEIKYALRRDFWGQGLATEAVRAMLDYGTTALGIDYVIATVAPENRASHRVLLKAGMQHGDLRENEDGSVTQLFEWRNEGQGAP